MRIKTYKGGNMMARAEILGILHNTGFPEDAQKARLLFRISLQMVGCITEQLVLLELRIPLSREQGDL